MTAITFNAEKYVMVPALARLRRVEVEKRLDKLKQYAETFRENKMEINDRRVGIITAGMPYNYAKEVFPDFSYLKLGMVYPLPEKLIRTFAKKVKKLYVLEELDPYLEEQIKALGIKVTGKENFPYTTEFDPGIIENAIKKHLKRVPMSTRNIPNRPPNLCPCCPHRGLFYVLGKQKVFVTGDIGCYTLSYMKPLSGLHSCICMGASVGMAHGMSKALKEKGKGKIVGVIGDSTFVHSGITSLLNMTYNKRKRDALIIICDNSTTAMTGMQEHPGTGGYTLQGQQAKQLDLKLLVSSLGIDNIKIIDPYNLKETKDAIQEELAKAGPSVIISQRACVLFKRKNFSTEKPLKIDSDKCTGCKACLGLGCPAISWQGIAAQEGSKRR